MPVGSGIIECERGGAPLRIFSSSKLIASAGTRNRGGGIADVKGEDRHNHLLQQSVLPASQERR